MTDSEESDVDGDLAEMDSDHEDVAAHLGSNDLQLRERPHQDELEASGSSWLLLYCCLNYGDLM